MAPSNQEGARASGVLLLYTRSLGSPNVSSACRRLVWRRVTWPRGSLLAPPRRSWRHSLHPAEELRNPQEARVVFRPRSGRAGFRGKQPLSHSHTYQGLVSRDTHLENRPFRNQLADFCTESVRKPTVLVYYEENLGWARGRRLFRRRSRRRKNFHGLPVFR
jgi:hypothetical protein